MANWGHLQKTDNTCWRVFTCAATFIHKCVFWFLKLKCVKAFRVIIMINCLNSYFGMTTILVHTIITENSKIFKGIFVQFPHVH